MNLLRTATRAMRAADPAAPFWTYDDLAAVMGLAPATVEKRMPKLQEAGFPAPLPYNRRRRCWRPEAVLGWLRRNEIRTGARPVDLRAVTE